MHARLVEPLRALARTLRAVSGWRLPRALALALVRGFNRGTFLLLERHPAVSAVYVRGSFVRGPFYPLASDVDWVVVLRASALAEPGSLRSVLVRLRTARRFNPSLRDWWQHLLTDRELALAGELWDLFGADEWRDRDGMPPPLASGIADVRRLLFAHWYQQTAWSASAVQKLVRPNSRLHDFHTGIRKAAFLAARLREIAAWDGPPPDAERLFALRRRHAAAFDAAYSPPGRDEASRLAALTATLGDLATSARILRGVVPRDLLPVPAVAPATDASFWPAELEPLREATACDGVLLGEGTLHVIVRDAFDAECLGALVEALRRSEPTQRLLTHLVPSAAIALWPLPCDATRPRITARPGIALALSTASPQLQRELLLFEAIFLPSAARLALTFPDSDQRLRRQLWAMLRAALLYADGRACATRAEISAACNLLPAGSEALRDIVARLDAADSQRTRESDLLAACEVLGERIFAALPRRAAVPEPVAFTGAARG